jgi:hypothetical protein
MPAMRILASINSPQAPPCALRKSNLSPVLEDRGVLGKALVPRRQHVRSVPVSLPAPPRSRVNSFALVSDPRLERTSPGARCVPRQMSLAACPAVHRLESGQLPSASRECHSVLFPLRTRLTARSPDKSEQRSE